MTTTRSKVRARVEHASATAMAGNIVRTIGIE
jgi:hypothetical protein